MKMLLIRTISSKKVTLRPLSGVPHTSERPRPSKDPSRVHRGPFQSISFFTAIPDFLNWWASFSTSFSWSFGKSRSISFSIFPSVLARGIPNPFRTILLAYHKIFINPLMFPKKTGRFYQKLPINFSWTAWQNKDFTYKE